MTRQLQTACGYVVPDQELVGFLRAAERIADYQQVPRRFVDDLRSAAAAAIVTAVPKYDSSYGVPLRPFVIQRIRWAIDEERRSITGGRRRDKDFQQRLDIAQPVPLSVALVEEADHERGYDAVEAAIALRQLLPQMSATDVEVLTSTYLLGEPLKVLAQRLDLTESAIGIRRKAAVKRLADLVRT